jgi:hypothetical protein
MRAAASSIARGIPSRRIQSSSTPIVLPADGLLEQARFWSCVAGVDESGGTAARRRSWSSGSACGAGSTRAMARGDWIGAADLEQQVAHAPGDAVRPGRGAADSDTPGCSVAQKLQG